MYHHAPSPLNGSNTQKPPRAVTSFQMPLHGVTCRYMPFHLPFNNVTFRYTPLHTVTGAKGRQEALVAAPRCHVAMARVAPCQLRRPGVTAAYSNRVPRGLLPAGTQPLRSRYAAVTRPLRVCYASVRVCYASVYASSTRLLRPRCPRCNLVIT